MTVVFVSANIHLLNGLRKIKHHYWPSQFKYKKSNASFRLNLKELKNITNFDSTIFLSC